MDKKVIIAIAVVAVVAIAAVAVFVVMNNNESKDTSKSDAKYALQIMGNANEDMTIDKKDLTIIEEIIAGHVKAEDYDYADANNDGKIDDRDVQVVKDLIDRKSGTKVFIVNLNFEGETIKTEATYPLTKIVPYGVNIFEPIVNIDGGKVIKAYFAKGYPNNEASVSGVDLKGGSRSIGDAAWQNFLTADASIHFDAFIVTYDARAQVLDTYVSDLKEANIPLICYAAADADGEVGAAVTLGFMFGGKSEELGKKYADIYEDVLKKIEDALKTVGDNKQTYIAMNMDTSICQNDSTYNTTGTVAGGLAYYKTDPAFAEKYKGASSTAASTVEALSNVDMDKILSYRSIDQVEDKAALDNVIKTRWEYKNSKGVVVKDLFEYSDDEDKVLYINNIIPAPARTAYSAYWLYPDLLTKEWADSVMQEFIDEGFTPYVGKTINQEIVTVFTYEDYQKINS